MTTDERAIQVILQTFEAACNVALMRGHYSRITGYPEVIPDVRSSVDVKC